MLMFWFGLVSVSFFFTELLVFLELGVFHAMLHGVRVFVLVVGMLSSTMTVTAKNLPMF